MKRPLLESPDPMERILDLLRQRKFAYDRFPQLKTTGKTAEELALELVGILKADAGQK